MFGRGNHCDFMRLQVLLCGGNGSKGTYCKIMKLFINTLSGYCSVSSVYPYHRSVPREQHPGATSGGSSSVPPQPSTTGFVTWSVTVSVSALPQTANCFGQGLCLNVLYIPILGLILYARVQVPFAFVLGIILVYCQLYLKMYFI